MIRKYEVILTMVFMSVFAGIYFYVNGSISKEASLTVFCIGVLSLLSITIDNNDLDRSLYALQDIEM